MMLFDLLAQYDVGQHNRIALIKVVGGVVVFLIAGVVGIVKAVGGNASDAIDESLLEEYGKLSPAALDKRRAKLTKNAGSWPKWFVLLALFVIGRHVYAGYKSPEDWSGHIEMILSYAVLYLAPAVAILLLLRDVAGASMRRLRVCTYLAMVSGCLILLWAAIVLIADRALWGAALAIGFAGLVPFGVGFSLWDVRRLRRYDQWLLAQADRLGREDGHPSADEMNTVDPS